MDYIKNKQADRLSAPAPHLSQGIGMSFASQTSHCKIFLDKYYTPIGIANHCWDKAFELLGPGSVVESIEPSVGGGAFLHHPDHAPSLAFDIVPECQSTTRTEVITHDFFTLDLPYRKGRLFIGNPPFGARNNLARAFYKKAVTMGDFIAFILPISQLNLGKCQCIDFAGQIAGLSLCMIQYNILGCVKRFEAYETIGGLFAEVTGETVELSVAQRIWGLIVEVINVIAGFIACNPFELIENVINNNNQIKAVKQAFDRLDLAGAAA